MYISKIANWISRRNEAFRSRCFKHSDPNDELQYSVVYSMNNRTNMIDQYKNSISLTAFFEWTTILCSVRIAIWNYGRQECKDIPLGRE